MEERSNVHMLTPHNNIKTIITIGTLQCNVLLYRIVNEKCCKVRQDHSTCTDHHNNDYKVSSVAYCLQPIISIYKSLNLMKVANLLRSRYSSDIWNVWISLGDRIAINIHFITTNVFTILVESFHVQQLILWRVPEHCRLDRVLFP